MLTGMYNRNKYIEVRCALEGQKLRQVGVGYMDLNGLKQVNDTQSHEAGDRYICGAAEAISHVFLQNGYRIGGDEFVIIVQDIAQEQFIQKTEELRKHLKESKVSVSAGFSWVEQCEDIDMLIRKTEEQMYDEKECYYQVHERRR